MPLRIGCQKLAREQINFEVTWDGAKLKLMAVKITITGISAPATAKTGSIKMWSHIQCYATFGQWVNVFQPYSTNPYRLTGETAFEAFWELIRDDSFGSDSSIDMREFKDFKLQFLVARFVTSLPLPFHPAKFRFVGSVLFLFLMLPIMAYY